VKEFIGQFEGIVSADGHDLLDGKCQKVEMGNVFLEEMIAFGIACRDASKPGTKIKGTLKLTLEVEE